MEKGRLQEKTHMRSLWISAQIRQPDFGVSHGQQHAECCFKQSQDRVPELCGGGQATRRSLGAKPTASRSLS